MAKQNMLWCQCIITSKLMELMGFLESLMKLQKKVECQIKMWQIFWHMNYLFWNLCFLVNLWTCIFPLLKFQFATTLSFWWTHLFKFCFQGWVVGELLVDHVQIKVLDSWSMHFVNKGKMHVLITWLWSFGFWLSMSKLGLLIFNMWTLVVKGRLGFAGS